MRHDSLGWAWDYRDSSHANVAKRCPGLKFLDPIQHSGLEERTNVNLVDSESKVWQGDKRSCGGFEIQLKLNSDQGPMFIRLEGLLDCGEDGLHNVFFSTGDEDVWSYVEEPGSEVWVDAFRETFYEEYKMDKRNMLEADHRSNVCENLFDLFMQAAPDYAEE